MNSKDMGFLNIVSVTFVGFHTPPINGFQFPEKD